MGVEGGGVCWRLDGEQVACNQAAWVQLQIVALPGFQECKNQVNSHLFAWEAGLEQVPRESLEVTTTEKDRPERLHEPGTQLKVKREGARECETEPRASPLLGCLGAPTLSR